MAEIELGVNIVGVALLQGLCIIEQYSYAINMLNAPRRGHILAK